MIASVRSLPSRAGSASIVTLETYRGPRLSFVRLTRRDAALAFLLFASALIARWPLIERGETLLHPDEAVVGLMAQDIAHGQRFPIYFYGQRYMGALEAYVIAAISSLFHDPIHALRMGPALFFAALVVLQYLMLTRWFGRAGGLLGAACLIAGSPMFAQWSISARGGYVENLTWGTALLWAYSEWFAFARPAGENIRRRRQFMFGLLTGSGFWINPAIAFFLIPIGIHALMSGPVQVLERSRVWRLLAPLGRCRLPVLALLAILALNICWSVVVEDGQVRTMFLLDSVPHAIGIPILFAIAGFLIVMTRSAVYPALRSIINSNVHLILGAMVGAMPAVMYVVQYLAYRMQMEPTLPLGFRPIWMTGETLVYFLCGLPLLFGADPQPFVSHVTVGRERTAVPLDSFWSATTHFANGLVAIAIIAACALILWNYRKELGRLLSVQSARYSPGILLSMGVVTTIALFLFGGCSCSFTTIRYLLPLWAFGPGLAAALFTSPRSRFLGRFVPLTLCLAWATGQYGLHRQIGSPHPLRELSTVLRAAGPEVARAEILDAQLLSYLTDQRWRVAEFQPFWPRLAHYRRPCRLPSDICRYGRPDQSQPSLYIVNTREWDRTSDWTDLSSPGPPPPETQRTLWPAIRRAFAAEPGLVLDRRALSPGYELFRLSRPLSETGL